MKVHRLLLLGTTVSAIAVKSELNKNETTQVDAKGSDKMKIKHLFAFPIFKFKLKLPFQNTSPNSIPTGQVGSVEEGGKASSVAKDWSFQSDATETPGNKEIADNDNDDEDTECDGAEKDEHSLPLTPPSKGFGDMFMEMMNVGKDLTMEKIEVLKDVLFLIDRIKEETETTGEESATENGDSESNKPEDTQESGEDASANGESNISPSVETQGSQDAKIDVWRLSAEQGQKLKLLKRHDITPEDLSNVVKLGDLKNFLRKSKSKGDNKEEEEEDDTDAGYPSDPLVKRKEDDGKSSFDINDFNKLKGKLGLSGKKGDDGDSNSKVKNIFKKVGDQKKQTEEKEDNGSRKIKSHFKKAPPTITTTLRTTITTVLESETDTLDEDCPKNKMQTKPKTYPYLHPKGEEYPDGLYDGAESSSNKEDCDGDESMNVPINLREKGALRSLSIRSDKAEGNIQVDEIVFLKRDDDNEWVSDYPEIAETPTNGSHKDFEDSDSDDNDDDDYHDVEEDNLGKKESKWSWKSIFGFGGSKSKEEPTSDDTTFESNWLLRKKLRSKKRKLKTVPTPTTTTTTILNSPKPTEAGTDDDDEDDPDCPKEKKERLREEKEEKLRKEKEALKNDKEALKSEKKLLKEKLKKIPKSENKMEPKKITSTGNGKSEKPPMSEIVLKGPSAKLKPVPSTFTPVSSVTSEKLKNLMLLIPDDGDAKLLSPEEFVSVAPDFDQALVVKVAYKTIQTAYNIANEKQSAASSNVADGTDDGIGESLSREHITKEKNNSVEMAFKNRKVIKDTVTKLFEENNESVDGFGSNWGAFDEEDSSTNFEGYDSFEAHQAIPFNGFDVDGGIEKVFATLKQSGLINDILNLSLKDKIVRSSLMGLTIEKIKNEQIPWDELLMASQAHGLNIDVDKVTFAKPEIGKLLSKFVLDVIPFLVQKGYLARLDVIQKLPIKEDQPSHEKPADDTERSLEIGLVDHNDAGHESRHVKLEKGHQEKHQYLKNFNLTNDHTLERHEEKNKKFEKEDHVKHFSGQKFEKGGHENQYSDIMTEQSEKVKDEDAIHKEGTKNEALHHHKERYHESAKLGQSKEERFESDRHEQRKEKFEQDYQLGSVTNAIRTKRDEIVHYEENFHDNVNEKHHFDLLELFVDGASKYNKQHHKEDNLGLNKDHHELNHHEEDHKNGDYVKDIHELDRIVAEKEHHKDYLHDSNHRKRHEIDHYEEDNHKEVTEHHESSFSEKMNDGSETHEKQSRNEDNYGLIKDERELNHHEKSHGDTKVSKDIHSIDQYIAEKEHHKNHEKGLTHEVRLGRRDDDPHHRDKLTLEKSLKSSTSFANESDKDHYESNRTLGGQRHSKEHYAKEHHEKERHETAPGVEQYEKEKHEKEEHAKENHELGPQEHEHIVKEHGKVGDKLALTDVVGVEKESELNLKANTQLQVTPPIPGQVVLPAIG